MDRCLIVFDLDAKLLEQHYHNVSWRNGYADIQRSFSRNCFTNIQGTVYLGESGVKQAHGTLALQEIATCFPWFEKCVSNIWFYNLVDGLNAQFVVSGVAQARAAFERGITVLRQQLLDAGLAADKIDEIIGQQQFPLENVTSNSLPKRSE